MEIYTSYVWKLTKKKRSSWERNGAMEEKLNMKIPSFRILSWKKFVKQLNFSLSLSLLGKESGKAI